MRLTRILDEASMLSPGDSIELDGISSCNLVFLLAYTARSGARSSVFSTLGNSNLCIPAVSGVQILNIAGDTLTALSSNTEDVTVYRVFGVNISV